MPKRDLPSNTKSQIAATMHVKDHNIDLQFVSVQEQHGDSDCGIFAIAFATSLCAKHNPAKTKITYTQDCLRPHLLHCLEERVFREFPGKIEQLHNSVERENMVMVQCDQCQE